MVIVATHVRVCCLLRVSRCDRNPGLMVIALEISMLLILCNFLDCLLARDGTVKGRSTDGAGAKRMNPMGGEMAE